MKGTATALVLASFGAFALAQDYSNLPTCPPEGEPCACSDENKMQLEEFGKIVWVNPDCTDHCNPFNLGDECHSCFVDCEGAKHYEDMIIAQGRDEEVLDFCDPDFEYADCEFPDDDVSTCPVPPACPATEADIMYLGLYDKCITVDTSCSDSTDGAPCHCAMFGLPQDCRGCYQSCEGAMKYLADYPSTPATEFFFCPSSGLTYETCAGGSSTPSADGIIAGDAPAPTPAFATAAPIALGEDGCACDGFGEECYMDESCSAGDLGCNVKGIMMCRFCGFGVYAEIACP